MSSSRDHRRQLYERLVGQPVAQGRFVITRLLGFGGMGAVYEAIQQNMNRKVALKLIPTHDPTIVARFEREALTISKLQHPNTITVFDFGQSEDGFLFLSMELLEGETLTDRIAAGPMEPQRAAHIAMQMCRSLAEAHRSGIVHRDVKPDNIILIRVDDDPDVVKVLDFGIAKAVMGEDDVQLTGDGRIIGTPRYMSPEQILAEKLDHRSDIYSLGCILFEMLCGAPPFQQSSTTALMISHTQDPPPTFAQQLPPGAMSQMPAGLERVVRRALSKTPAHRHQSCDELREDLEAAISGRYAIQEGPETAAVLPPAATSQPMATAANPDATLPAEPQTKRAPAFLAIGIIALVIVIVGLLALNALGPDDTEVAEAAVEEPTPALPPVVEEEPTVDVKEIPPEVIDLTIKSEPSGAKVYEGESLIGVTPVTIPVAAKLKKHEYRLVKRGYQELAVTVPVRPDGDVAIERMYELEETKPVAAPPAEKKPKRPAAVSKRVKEEPPKETEPKVPSVQRLEDGPKADVPLLGK